MNKEMAYSQLEELGVFYIKQRIETIIDNFESVLFVTNCTKTKGPQSKGFPHEIYLGSMSQRFYNIFLKSAYNMETLSDKWGLVKRDQIIENYDLAPGDLGKEGKDKLSKLIEKQIPKEITAIVFCNYRLLQSLVYLKMLSKACKNRSIKLYYVSNFQHIVGRY